jgi:hypothetical protein
MTGPSGPAAPDDDAGTDAEVAATATGSGTSGGGPRSWLDMSRRRFLRTGSIGVAAVGAAGAVPGLGSLLSSGAADAPEVQGSASAVEGEGAGTASGAVQTIGAHISDVDSGEMRLFAGNQTFTIQDPQLTQQLARAVRAAQSTP